MTRPQEFLDHRDHPQSDVIHSQFLVPGAECPAFLEPADDSFDQVALAVAGFVEVVLPRLILACRDDGFDVMPPEPAPDMGVAPAFVPRQLGRPVRYPSASGQEDASHQRFKGRRFVLLARRHIDPQHDAAVGDEEVDFGAEATARVSQRMLRRLFELRRLGPAQARNDARIFFPPRLRHGWRE